MGSIRRQNSKQYRSGSTHWEDNKPNQRRNSRRRRQYSTRFRPDNTCPHSIFGLEGSTNRRNTSCLLHNNRRHNTACRTGSSYRCSTMLPARRRHRNYRSCRRQCSY